MDHLNKDFNQLKDRKIESIFTSKEILAICKNQLQWNFFFNNEMDNNLYYYY